MRPICKSQWSNSNLISLVTRRIISSRYVYTALSCCEDSTRVFWVLGYHFFVSMTPKTKRNKQTNTGTVKSTIFATTSNVWGQCSGPYVEQSSLIAFLTAVFGMLFLNSVKFEVHFYTFWLPVQCPIGYIPAELPEFCIDLMAIANLGVII